VNQSKVQSKCAHHSAI